MARYQNFDELENLRETVKVLSASWSNEMLKWELKITTIQEKLRAAIVKKDEAILIASRIISKFEECFNSLQIIEAQLRILSLNLNSMTNSMLELIEKNNSEPQIISGVEDHAS